MIEKLETNVVVLFRKFEELAQEQLQIEAEHRAEWDKAFAVYDRAMAAVDGDEATLEKLDAPDVTVAKAEAARLKNIHIRGGVFEKGWQAGAKLEISRDLLVKLEALTLKRNARVYGFNALAKRSARFAAAQDRKNYGPGAGRG